MEPQLPVGTRPFGGHPRRKCAGGLALADWEAKSAHTLTTVMYLYYHYHKHYFAYSSLCA